MGPAEASKNGRALEAWCTYETFDNAVMMLSVGGNESGNVLKNWSDDHICQYEGLVHVIFPLAQGTVLLYRLTIFLSNYLKGVLCQFALYGQLRSRAQTAGRTVCTYLLKDDGKSTNTVETIPIIAFPRPSSPTTETEPNLDICGWTTQLA